MLPFWFLCLFSTCISMVIAFPTLVIAILEKFGPLCFSLLLCVKLSFSIYFASFLVLVSLLLYLISVYRIIALLTITIKIVVALFCSLSDIKREQERAITFPIAKSHFDGSNNIFADCVSKSVEKYIALFWRFCITFCPLYLSKGLIG